MDSEIDKENEELPTTRNVQVGDLPVSGQSGIMIVTSKNPSKKKHRSFFFLIFSCMILLAISVLAALLARKVDFGGVKESTSSGRFDTVKQYIVSNGYSSFSQVSESSTPQYLAARFMASDEISVPSKASSYGERIAWMERYVLTVFFYAMDGPSWKSRFDFTNHDVETCSWGISSEDKTSRINKICNANKRVSLMSLERNKLKGVLPTELGLLDDLIFFHVSSNSISGTIPADLQDLKKITIFAVDNNLLSGPIPEWICKWTNLEMLNFQNNQMTGSIPSNLKELTNLKELCLEDNIFTGDLNHIAGFESLVDLYVERNSFSQKIDSSFLVNLPNLKRLDISENNFSGNVPVDLFAGGSLDILDAHGNDLDYFPDRIPENGTLTFLALHQNPLKDTFPTNTILNLKNLKHLDLTSTNLSGTMPEELGYLSKLEYLFLADTSFTPGTIPNMYKNLEALVDLSIKQSGRVGVIPPWIDTWENLILLDLDSNDLSGRIPEEIGNMTELRYLLLHRNNLNGSVPEELGNAVNLQYLFLDHNALTGTLNGICDQITMLTRATSDCGIPTAEITCSCCQVCCDDNNITEVCSEHAEYDFIALIDPNWGDSYERPSEDFTVYYSFNDNNITRRGQ